MSVKINTRNFDRAVLEMSRLSGVKFEDVLKSEIGSVLSATITNTPKATTASIQKSLAKWIFIKDPSPARRPQSTLSNGTAYLLTKVGRGSHRYPDEIWAWIQMNKEQRVAELKRRIGTAKKSWVLLAQKMKIPLPKTPPAYVQKSVVKGQSLTEQVDFTRKTSGSKAGFLTRNFTRAAVRGGGKAALLKAINGRTGYFHRNVKKGVFKKAGEIAKKYPGFKVRGI